jgi:hypothetical protein
MASPDCCGREEGVHVPFNADYNAMPCTGLPIFILLRLGNSNKCFESGLYVTTKHSAPKIEYYYNFSIPMSSASTHCIVYCDTTRNYDLTTFSA